MGAERSASVYSIQSPSGFEHAVADGVALAAIAGVLDHTDTGGAGDFGGAVARAVVDHHDLGEFPAGGVEIASDLFEGRAQAALFVVGGNDYGNGSAQAKPYNN